MYCPSPQNPKWQLVSFIVVSTFCLWFRDKLFFLTIIPKAREEENISLFKFRNKHEVFNVNTQNEAAYFNPSYMLPEIVKNSKITSCAQFAVEI